MSFPFPNLYWASPSCWTLIYTSPTCSMFDLVMAQGPLQVTSGTQKTFTSRLQGSLDWKPGRGFQSPQ